MKKDNDKDKAGRNDEEDGNALWQMIARTVKPITNNLFHPNAVWLDEVSAPVHQRRVEINAKETPATIVHKQLDKTKSIVSRNLSSEGARELDRSLNEKLRRGQLPIDLKIDLHGHTRQQAQHVLQATLLGAYKVQKRCILVVTGKGKNTKHGNGGDYVFEAGILKQLVPQWLAEDPLAEIVLKTHTARPKDGGTGALYVLLRRQR